LLLYELISYKKWLFHEYEKHLVDVDGIQLSAAKNNIDPSYWISVAIVDGKYGMNKDCGLLVNSSRGIIYAGSGADFAEKAKVEAKKLQQEMAVILSEVEI